MPLNIIYISFYIHTDYDLLNFNRNNFIAHTWDVVHSMKNSPKVCGRIFYPFSIPNTLSHILNKHWLVFNSNNLKGLCYKFCNLWDFVCMCVWNVYVYTYMC